MLGTPNRFDDSLFFEDEFFTKPSASDTGTLIIVRGTAPSLLESEFPCIYRSELDPEKYGALLTRGGTWAMVEILAADWEAVAGEGSLPAEQATVKLNGTEYQVDSRNRAGGIIRMYVVCNLRTNR